MLEALDERTTLLTTGSDQLDSIVFHVAMLDVDFRVVEPAVLRERMHAASTRLSRC